MKTTITFDFSPTATLEQAFSPSGRMTYSSAISIRLARIVEAIKEKDVFKKGGSMEVELDDGDWRVLKDGLVMAAASGRMPKVYDMFMQRIVMTISHGLEAGR